MCCLYLKAQATVSQSANSSKSSTLAIRHRETSGTSVHGYDHKQVQLLLSLTFVYFDACKNVILTNIQLTCLVIAAPNGDITVTYHKCLVSTTKGSCHTRHKWKFLFMEVSGLLYTVTQAFLIVAA